MRSRQRQTTEKALPRLALNLAFSDVVDFVIEMKIVGVDRIERLPEMLMNFMDDEFLAKSEKGTAPAHRKDGCVM